MKSIKTLEEAKILPEKGRFGWSEEILPDGTIVKTPSFRDLVAVELEDDTLLLFADEDGEIKEVGYDEDGAYKTDALIPEPFYCVCHPDDLHDTLTDF